MNGIINIKTIRGDIMDLKGIIAKKPKIMREIKVMIGEDAKIIPKIEINTYEDWNTYGSRSEGRKQNNYNNSQFNRKENKHEKFNDRRNKVATIERDNHIDEENKSDNSNSEIEKILDRYDLN